MSVFHKKPRLISIILFAIVKHCKTFNKKNKQMGNYFFFINENEKQIFF